MNNMIRDYFSEVEKKLEEIISEEMGIIKGKIVFVNHYVLDFRELVSDEHPDYRFHFMNGRVVNDFHDSPRSLLAQR